MIGVAGNPPPVRSPLEVLALQFPQYRIWMRGIGGRLFYLAEAVDPHVQPRFAQAETRQFTGHYDAGDLHHHSRADVAGFLHGLDLITPGITEARAWHAPRFIPSYSRRGHIWAAVARKPAPADPGRP